MQVVIYGASDDLVEVSGCKGADEFTAPSGDGQLWRGDLVSPDGASLRVHAWYDSPGGGAWQIAAGQVDEDMPLPSWPMRLAQGVEDIPSYATGLVIDAPEGTRLTNVGAWPSQ